MATLSESELRALTRRELQQLCKRADVSSWRRIKANTKSSAMIAQLFDYFSSLTLSTSAAALETSQRTLDAMRSGGGSVNNAAVPASGGVAADSEGVVISDQQLDDSDGEIYFNVSVVRHPEQPAPTVESTQRSGPCQPAVAEAMPATAVPARAVVPSPNVVRKRKCGEQSAVPAVAVGARAAEVSGGAKRPRLSASTKLVRQPNSDYSRRQSLHRSMRDSKAAAPATVSSTRGPSAALSLSSSEARPLSTTARTSAQVDSVAPSVAHNTAYTAMLAELNARVARASSQPSSQRTARDDRATLSAPPALAARLIHNTKASKSATFERYDRLHKQHQDKAKSIVQHYADLASRRAQLSNAATSRTNKSSSSQVRNSVVGHSANKENEPTLISSSSRASATPATYKCISLTTSSTQKASRQTAQRRAETAGKTGRGSISTAAGSSGSNSRAAGGNSSNAPFLWCKPKALLLPSHPNQSTLGSSSKRTSNVERRLSATSSSASNVP